MAASPTPTLYDLLQVRSDATTQDVRNAWRRLAQEHHPDRGGAGDAEAMARINQAYEILSDPDKRARYDQQLLALRQPRRRGWRTALRLRAAWVAAAAVSATAMAAAGAWLVLRPASKPAPPGPAAVRDSQLPSGTDAPLVLTPSRRIEHWGAARPLPAATTAPGRTADGRARH